MSADPKLVDRVLKLFALAAGTPFGAEAEAARAKAEALIARHAISLPSAVDRGAFGFVDYWPHFKGMKWELILAEATAALCGCKSFRWIDDGEELRRDKPFRLAGTIADLEACQYLLAALHEQRMRDWLRAKAEGRSDNFHSFCFSFARGVEQLIQRQTTKLAAANTQSAYLWYKETHGLAPPRSINLLGAGRSEAGREAGAAASLHRGNLSGMAAKRIGHVRRLPS